MLLVVDCSHGRGSVLSLSFGAVMSRSNECAICSSAFTRWNSAARWLLLVVPERAALGVGGIPKGDRQQLSAPAQQLDLFLRRSSSLNL